MLLRLIRAVWLARRDNRAFGLFLREWGFRMAPVSFKHVAIGRAFVVKWDGEGGDGHTDAEARQYERARPHKKRYLAKTFLHLPGLLIQEKLPVVHKTWIRKCPEGCPAEKVARRLRILDWGNHGFRADGSLRFFDADSLGSGWYSWRKR